MLTIVEESPASYYKIHRHSVDMATILESLSELGIEDQAKIFRKASKMSSYNFGKVLFSDLETKNLTITTNGIILKNKGNKTLKDETKRVIYNQ